MTATAAPDRPLAPFGARVAPITDVTRHGAYTVLHCRDADGPAPAPGQFYMLMAAERWGGGSDERPYLPRAFSVLRARPAQGATELDFLLDAVGPGTTRLCELRAGDGLSLLGPLGRPFPDPAPGETPLLVGGGVGIAPLAILADALRAAAPSGPAAAVLLGFRDAEHAGGAELIDQARVATDDGSAGHHGLVTDLLSAELAATERPHVYACGPPAMLEAVRRMCEAPGPEGTGPVACHLALESGMACGYGACFGCVVPTRHGLIRLCIDGPVLEAGELESALIPGTGH